MSDDSRLTYYDVFLSYRHRDASRIDELKKKIEAAGFTVFRDTDTAELKDPEKIDKNVEKIRRHISRSTCLVFAYSRPAEEPKPATGIKPAEAISTSVGVWMPWELGFFDGCISARIGVYLLDGPPADFKGSEYLQLYPTLETDAHLQDFLKRNAVRERRIDNVESAFIWLEHLSLECLTNPANVAAGIAEWYADHAARSCAEMGAPELGRIFGDLKTWLDDWRVTTARTVRVPWVDDLVASLRAVPQGRPDITAPLAILDMWPPGAGDAATHRSPERRPFGYTEVVHHP